MKPRLLLVAGALLLGVSTTPASALQCVPYAREVSGINLQGNAWQWWQAAAGRYERGRIPRDGAVMVFPNQGNMRYGHLAVVTRVVSNRLILVDHANWAPAGSSERGRIALSVPVLDVSPRNDWGQVRVWYRPTEDYGIRVYNSRGFVYAAPGTESGRPAPDVERQALIKANAILTAASNPPILSEHRLSEASTDGLVTVARHHFRPRAPTQASAGLASHPIFN